MWHQRRLMKCIGSFESTNILSKLPPLRKLDKLTETYIPLIKTQWVVEKTNSFKIGDMVLEAFYNKNIAMKDLVVRIKLTGFSSFGSSPYMSLENALKTQRKTIFSTNLTCALEVVENRLARIFEHKFLPNRYFSAKTFTTCSINLEHLKLERLAADNLIFNKDEYVDRPLGMCDVEHAKRKDKEKKMKGLFCVDDESGFRFGSGGSSAGFLLPERSPKIGLLASTRCSSDFGSP